MDETRWDRRSFLRASALMAGGWGAMSLTGCGTLDRLFGPDPGLYDNEVLIIGGGLAGLTAGYELKKRKIPFRILEASSRPGGRVQTLKFFDADNHWAELGGEYVDPRHLSVLDLCSELNLPLDQVPLNANGSATSFWSRQQIVSQDVLSKELSPVLSQLIRRRQDITGEGDRKAEASRLDQQSLKDFLESLRTASNGRALDYLSQAARVQFGVETEQQSALQFLSSLDPEARASRVRRIRGGSESLTRTLYERVKGVLPEFIVRFKTSLLSVKERGPLFECRIQTPRGTQTVWTRCLIFALPPPALRKIGGLKELQLSEERKSAIQGMKLATHSKLVMGFNEKFWLGSGGPILGGTLLGLPASQSCDDVSRGLAGSSGLLSFTMGGEAGMRAGADMASKALKDLQAVWKQAPSAWSKKEVLRNWSSQAEIGGSVLSYAPSEMSRWSGVFSEGDYSDRIFFAGEHTSTTFYGSMQGAVESGRRAAARVGAALEKLLQ
ncbi:MAG: FAD-dependent oxidoreductase, partial [Bdellovibrionaceae bacterium]|nr:FAD-dependent oxidoreductase [Pseudobdellovibrionaceae bacterium]